jgi:hypothetical protein
MGVMSCRGDHAFRPPWRASLRGAIIVNTVCSRATSDRILGPLPILHLCRCGLLIGFLFTPCLVHGQLVFELARRANSADSSAHYAEAARLWRQVYGVDGGDPGPLFAVAESATRAGDHESAFAALRQAIDEGFRIPVGALEADSSLQALHNGKRWTALMARTARLASRRDTALRSELLSLGERDQRNRDSIGAVVRRSGLGSPEAEAANRALATADAPLQARLRAIVSARGWPGRRLAGDDGAHAAWLLLQHADPAYQRKMLPVIHERVLRGDIRPADWALLEDRVRMNQGRKQRFGSQFRYTTTPGAPPVLYPIEAEECVDQRRGHVRLPPLADYLGVFGVKHIQSKKRCQ